MKFLSSRLFLLTFLYFIQGLPYGLQSRFMPIFLRARGVSLTNVGFFKMLLAPWLCKTLWAPLVDQKGTKHQWLLWSILGMSITCLLSSLISPDQFTLLCLIIFILNVCAATQDVAVDSIAVTMLNSDDLAKGNTAQVVGYKLGSIFGGGFLVWFLDHLGWSGMFVCLAVMYLQAFLFVYVSPSLQQFRVKTVTPHSDNQSLKESSSAIVTDSDTGETEPYALEDDCFENEVSSPIKLDQELTNDSTRVITAENEDYSDKSNASDDESVSEIEPLPDEDDKLIETNEEQPESEEDIETDMDSSDSSLLRKRQLSSSSCTNNGGVTPCSAECMCERQSIKYQVCKRLLWDRWEENFFLYMKIELYEQFWVVYQIYFSTHCYTETSHYLTI